MKYILVFYIGLTMGLCLMDFLTLWTKFRVYKNSHFNLIICLLLSPILVPINLIKNLSNK